MELKAQALDQCLFDFLAVKRRGRLHGHFHRAFSVECEERLISVLAEPPLLPFSLLLPAEDFLYLPLADPVFLDRTSLRSGELRIDLATSVHPQPPLPSTLDLARLQANLACFERYVEAFGDLRGYELVRPRLKAIRQAADYQALVGVGLGLTPSGDDFLVGSLLALYGLACTGRESPLREPLRTHLRVEGTTKESLHFLRCALEDRFSHGWIRLLRDLFSQESFTIEKACPLIRHGATSGTDLALGLIRGLKVGAGLLEKGEP